MTLATNIHINTTLSPEDLFDLQLRAILAAGDVEDRYASAQTTRHVPGQPYWPGGTYLASDYGISTVIGQGLPAITDISWQEDSKPYTADILYGEFDPSDYHEDEVEEAREEAREERANFPEAVYRLGYDTGYAYTGPNNIGCSVLHARAIHYIYAGLPEGSTLHWQNEFTGEWHEGLDGFDEFIGNGAAATNWFSTQALPAILSHINSKEN